MAGSAEQFPHLLDAGEKAAKGTGAVIIINIEIKEERGILYRVPF